MMDANTRLLFEEIKAVMEEEGVDGDTLTLDTPLKELELSSMQFLRVVGALEDLVGIPLDAGIGEIETSGGLIANLQDLKEAA